jgi:RHS repeat-associated protein
MNRPKLAVLALASLVVGYGHGCDRGGTLDESGRHGSGRPYDVELSSHPLVDPATTVVNTGTDVGTAPGDFSVGPDGSANYRVPLWTPDSVSDATRPALALRYSSTAGEGRLGYGWDVEGLSEITRCQQGQLLNEPKAPIKFTNQDALCLDGLRLMFVSEESGSSTEGTAGAVYYTLPDRQARIKIIADDSMGPLTFEVRTADGLIHEYGAWAGSEGAAADGWRANWTATQTDPNVAASVTYSRVRYAWSRWKTKDRFGNRMQTYYWARLPGVCSSSLDRCSDVGGSCPNSGGICSSGQCSVSGNRCLVETAGQSNTCPVSEGTCEAITHEPQPLPKYIEYGGGAGDSLRRQVIFYYASRTNEAMRTKYVSGVKFQNRWRNYWIEMRAPDPASANAIQIFRGYYIDIHALSATQHEMVKSIKECDGDAKSGPAPGVSCKKASEFSYEPASNDYTLLVNGPSPVDDIRQNTDPAFWRIQIADFNNDGRDDIAYRTGPYGDDWKISLSNCQSDLTGCRYDRGLLLNMGGQLGGLGGPDPYDLTIGDWDLDGYPDIATIDPDGHYRYYRNDRYGTTFTEFQSIPDVPTAASKGALFANTNGKGHPYFMRPHKTSSAPDIGDLLQRSPASSGWLSPPGGAMGWFAPSMDTDWNFHVADVDGDGASDVLMRRASANRRLSAQLEMGGPQLTIQNTTLPISEPTVPRKYYFADLNGDGISDAIQLVGGADNGLRTIENTGNGFKNPIAATLPSTAWNVRTNANTTWMDLVDPGIRLFDYDGDGRDDIVLVDDGRIRTSVPGGAFNHATRSTVRVLLARNSGFEVLDLGIDIGVYANGKIDRDLPSGAGSRTNWLLSDVLDANGDGQMDIATVTAAGILQVWVKDTKPADKMTRVKDGMGYRTDITYSPLSKNTVYTPGTSSSCSYPRLCVVRSRDWVVEKYRTDNGISLNQNTTSFLYYDAQTDVEIDTPLGFSKRKVTYDPPGSADHTVETLADTFLHTDVALEGTSPAKSARIYRYSLTSPSMIEEIISTPNGVFRRNATFETEVVRSQSNKTAYSNVRATDWYESHNGQLLRQVLTTHPISSWKDYGIVESFETKVLDGSFNIVERRTNTQEFSVFARDTHWLWAPHREVVTSEVPGAVPAIQQRTYDFDINSTTGAVTDAYVEKNSTENDIYLRTTFTRTARGKLDGVVHTDRQGNVRNLGYVQYDALEGIYPEYYWNALGHQTTLVTHRGLGVVGEVQDANGASTTFTYDRFGRMRTNQTPGGGGLAWTYARDYEAGSSAADERFIYLITQTANGGGFSKELVNRLGQTIRREQRRADPQNYYGGIWFTAVSNLTYDAIGTLQSVTRPAWLLAPLGAATTYLWDNLGRPTSITSPGTGDAGGGTSTIEYVGLQETHTDPAGHQTRITRNAADWIIRQESKNDAGQWVPTDYAYGPFGVLRYVRRTPASGGTPIQTEIIYDIRGRRTLLHDPDARTRETRYNAFDEVRQTLNGKSEITTYTRDALGREDLHESPNETVDTVWDMGTGAKGQISEIIRGSVKRKYAYDSFGRLIKDTLVRTNSSPAQEYAIEFDYRSDGRLSRIRYPFHSGSSRVDAEYTYDPNTGDLKDVYGITDPWGSWVMNRLNPDGQIELETFANGAVTTRTYYPETGRVSNITTALSGASIQDLAYKYWDGGNLKSRANNLVLRYERFTYDAMDRIQWWRWTNSSGGTSLTAWRVLYTIDDLGRLTQRWSKPSGTAPSQTRTYLYESTGNAGPHAVTSSSYGSYQYDLNGNQVARPDGETIAYNDDDLPRVISGPRPAEFEYDGEGRRVEKRKPLTGDVTVYLDDLYEKRTFATHTEHVHYIPGPGGAVAEVTRRISNGIVTNLPTRYIHRDNLGSVETVSCNLGDSGCGTTQTAQQGLSYDPFGNEMSWTSFNKHLPASLGEAPNSYRKFTDHEHDAEQSLINMRGRIFDPRTARFLTPDPIVQSPFYGQSYDRYAYVINNPLKYVDPSGYISLGLVWRLFGVRSNQGAGDAKLWEKDREPVGDGPAAAGTALSAAAQWAIGLATAHGAVLGPNQAAPAGPRGNSGQIPVWHPSSRKPLPSPEAGTPGTGGGGSSRVGYGTVGDPSSGGAPPLMEGEDTPGEPDGIARRRGRGGLRVWEEPVMPPPAPQRPLREMRLPRGVSASLLRLNQFLRNKLNHIRQQSRPGGNQGVTGAVTPSEAWQLGQHFVGPGFTRNDVGLTSADGLRQFRAPTVKRGINPATNQPWSKTGVQANFETRNVPSGPFQSNVHLDVTR